MDVDGPGTGDVNSECAPELLHQLLLYPCPRPVRPCIGLILAHMLLL